MVTMAKETYDFSQLLRTVYGYVLVSVAWTEDRIPTATYNGSRPD